MSKVTAVIKREFRAMLPPTIFFFVAFHIIAIIHALMLKGMGVTTTITFSVTVGALILGKAVLIADKLPWINRFPDRPLIYNVAWKTAIYQAVALVFHYLENLVHFAREAGGIMEGNRLLLHEIVWQRTLAIQIMLLALIVSYVSMHELVRVIGRERVMRAFFGPMEGKGSER